MAYAGLNLSQNFLLESMKLVGETSLLVLLSSRNIFFQSFYVSRAFRDLLYQALVLCKVVFVDKIIEFVFYLLDFKNWICSLHNSFTNERDFLV